jgi:hypothetical protein
MPIVRSNHRSNKAQVKLVLMTLVNLVDCLIVIVSLGFLFSDMHVPILFSEWMEDK